MSDVLPSELFWGILNRVPFEPLLRFRCVCSEWRRMIEDQTFIRSHFRRHSGSDRIMIRAREARTATSTTTKPYTLSLESLYDLESKTTVWAEPISISAVVSHNISRLPLPSCDGLILIPPYHKQEVWSLWNSYTRKSIELPLYDDDVKRGGMCLCGGLGYDPATDDYKVVRIAQFHDRNNEADMLETSIYSLKLNKWRRIEDFPNCSIPRRSVDGLFANGALHWMTNVKRKGQGDQEMEWIVALDLGTENYHLLPLPSVLYAQNESSFFGYKNLNVMDECLFMICHSSENGLEGWMMKDCGGTNSSWTRLFSFKQQPGIVIGGVRLLAYLKNKRQVLIHHSYDQLFWVDVEKKSAKRVSLWGTPYYFTSQVLPASLVRLNNNSKLKLSLAITRA